MTKQDNICDPYGKIGDMGDWRLTMNADKILICDDDEELCEFIGNYLHMHNYSIVTTSRSDQFIQLVEKELPDLVILDVQMPGLDGFTLCKQIRAQLTIPILFLTGMTQGAERLKGFEAGADDYIIKPFQFGELLARIKANLRWGKQLKLASGEGDQKQRLIFADLTIDLQTYQVTVRQEEVHLQPKEIQLLIVLASKPLQLFSQEQLFAMLWGDMSSSGPETVKVHIRNLRTKIELDPSKPLFIETIRGLGYRFVGKGQVMKS
jgi:DNA-binding response OmpR family regulator